MSLSEISNLRPPMLPRPPHARRATRPRAVLAALALLAPACSEVNGSDGDGEGAAAGPLEVQPTLLELPAVAFGRSASGDFHLRNRLDEPLRISRIGPTGCDCSVVSLRFPERPAGRDELEIDPDGIDVELGPGERAVLRMDFSTARYREPVSRKHGGIPVVLEGHGPVILEWAVDVWTPFQLEPWSRNLGQIGVRERAETSVLLQAKDDARFTPVIPPEKNGWKLSLTQIPGEDFDRYQLDLLAPPEMPLGTFQEEFEVRTDVPGGPVLSLFVRGEVVPDLTVHPRRILFQAVRPTSQDLTLLMRDPARRAPVPRLELAGDAASQVRAEILVQPDPQRVHLRLHCEEPPPERTLSGKLILHLDDEEVRRLEVPFALMPRRPDRG